MVQEGSIGACAMDMICTWRRATAKICKQHVRDQSVCANYQFHSYVIWNYPLNFKSYHYKSSALSYFYLSNDIFLNYHNKPVFFSIDLFVVADDIRLYKNYMTHIIVTHSFCAQVRSNWIPNNRHSCCCAIYWWGQRCFLVIFGHLCDETVSCTHVKLLVWFFHYYILYYL